MKCNFEGISFDSDTILGVSVFVACEEPKFDRLFLEEKMVEVGYDVASIFSRRMGVENEITASNLIKTMVKILEREFTDSVPIESTFWFLPSRPGIQTAVDKLNLFLSKLQDCVRLITIPILDNAENRASFWELICKDIDKRVKSITKKAKEMELRTLSFVRGSPLLL